MRSGSSPPGTPSSGRLGSVNVELEPAEHLRETPVSRREIHRGRLLHLVDDVVRLDANLTKKMQLFLRAARDVDDTGSPFRVGPGLGGYVNIVPGYAFTAHLTQTLTPKLVNEVVIGLGHNNYGFYHSEPDSTYFRICAA